MHSLPVSWKRIAASSLARIFNSRGSRGASFSARLLRSLFVVLIALGTSQRVSAQKLVVGHQMLAMPRYGGSTDVNGMREEVRQWKDMGLDAAMLFDIGGLDGGGQQLAANGLRYHEAGVAEGFKFAMSMSYFGPEEIQRYADYVRQLSGPKYAAARLFKNGKVYLSAYHASTNLAATASLLNNSGYPVYFEPMAFVRGFNGDPYTQPWENGYITASTPETLTIQANHPNWNVAEGFAAFEISRSIPDQGNQLQWLWDANRAKGHTARGSVVAYYKGFAHKGNWMCFEGWGYERLRSTLKTAISSGIPGIEFITLNDFSESSYFNSWGENDPSIIINSWTSADLPSILDHSGFRYFAKRYIQWFKTGVEPAITEDELYYSYRLHPRDATDYVNQSAAQKAAIASLIPSGLNPTWVYRKDGLPSSYSSWGNNWNVGIDWTKFSDGFHVAVRLKSPADVYINGVLIGSNLPAGEHLLVKPGARYDGDSGLGYPSYTFGPSDYGTPTFEIRRNGVSVISEAGPMPVTDNPVPGCWNVLARRAAGSGNNTGGIATVTAPTPTITAPTASASFNTGTAINVSTTLSGSTSALARVEFYDGSTLIGQTASSPYSISWTGATAGTHYLTAHSVNNDGSSATSIAVSITVSTPVAPAVRSPYLGTCAAIPGRLQVESYDQGGAGLAYSDTTAPNYGGALRTDGVDIETGGTGYNLGYFQGGEWMLYSVNVAKTARYVATVPVACAIGGGTFRVELDGVDISGTLTIPNTGSWTNWQTLSFEADITAGNHDLKIVGLADSPTSDVYGGRYVGNLDYIDFAEKIVIIAPAPTPTITSPVAGSTFDVGTAIPLSATLAGSTSALARVEFYAGTALIGQATTSPYSFSWTSATAGTYSLTAKSINTTGTTATSAAVSITVRAAAPKPTISAPTAGASFNPGIAIPVTVTLSGSTAQLARVEFYDGATKIGQVTASPYTISWTGAASGSHSLTAVAINSTGASATSAAVSIAVNAPAPTPTISAPTANATFNSGASIAITATLSGSTTQLARVEFYDGATKLGQATTSPYSISWSGAAAGVHSLTAVAVNTTGVSATSAAVSITVNAPAPIPTITAPTADATVASGSSIVITSTLSGSTSALARVEYYDGATKIGQATASPYTCSWSGAAVGAHSLTAVAVNATGVSATSASVSLTVSAPAPSNPVNSVGALATVNIGSPAIAGSATFFASTSSFQVVAAGVDIWDYSDQFAFVQQPITGDGEIIVRVASLVQTNVWAKAGLMLRTSSAPDAQHVSVFVTPANGTVMQWRATAAGVSTTTYGNSGVAPHWLKLVRKGDTFISYHSADGTTWEQISSLTLALPQTLIGGLALTSHNASAATTAVFDHLTLPTDATVTPPASAPVTSIGSLTAADIGAPGIAGAATFDSATGTFQVRAAGVDIWDNADQFGFVQQSISGDADLIVRVASLVQTDVWAKAGLMLRTSLAADAQHVSVFVTPANGTVMQWRSTTGGVSYTTYGNQGVAPQWLKLSRRGDTFSSYRSANGTTWEQISSFTLTLPKALLGGLAVTSHNAGAATTATFDHFALPTVASPAINPLTAAEIGAPGISGSTTFDASKGSYAVRAAGVDIWDYTDQLAFTSQTQAGDAEMIVHVSSLVQTDIWAKAGLMMRASNAPGAQHVSVFVTPGNGVVLQWRSATGGASNTTAGLAGTAPQWLRLVRTGNTFYAFRSVDGKAWDLVNSVTVALPTTALGGLAVTSHNPNALTTANFDSFTAD